MKAIEKQGSGKKSTETCDFIGFDRVPIDPDFYAQRPRRVSREERDIHSARLEKHYMTGTWYGQSAAGTIYILATVLERVDNELLW